MNDGDQHMDSYECPVDPDLAADHDQVRAKFSTTRWTMIVAAGLKSDERAHVAMEDLCQVYWYPLYAHVRRRGYTKEDAEDLTQSFFMRLLENNPLNGLSPERGRFRAFLLAALKHFLANEWDKARSQKRGGKVKILSIDCGDAESRYLTDTTDNLSPDKLYDRTWAMTLLNRVLQKLEIINTDNPYFHDLKPCLTAERSALNYADVATKLGISEGAVRVAIHRMRRQYRETLRSEIADTLANPNQLEEEIQALFSSFSE
jgi:RNA polymerase sigma-70 factor (ECF subfamily)